MFLLSMSAISLIILAVVMVLVIIGLSSVIYVIARSTSWFEGAWQDLKAKFRRQPDDDDYV